VLSDEGCPPPDNGGNKSTPAVAPSLAKFPKKLPFKKVSNTIVPVSCPTGCTLEMQASGFGKKSEVTKINVALDQPLVKLTFKLKLPGYTPAQLVKTWKQKIGTKKGEARDNIGPTLSVTAVNSAGKSETKKIKLTLQ
jgi:hypothetical protein